MHGREIFFTMVGDPTFGRGGVNFVNKAIKSFNKNYLDRRYPKKLEKFKCYY